MAYPDEEIVIKGLIVVAPKKPNARITEIITVNKDAERPNKNELKKTPKVSKNKLASFSSAHFII